MFYSVNVPTSVCGCYPTASWSDLGIAEGGEGALIIGGGGGGVEGRETVCTYFFCISSLDEG
jgi:hypothetical protein